MNDEYINTSQARTILNVSTQTLRMWDKKNKIRTIRTPSNIRLYNKQDIYDIIGRDIPFVIKQKIVYARVSSKKQLDDLERQIHFLRTKYPNHLVVTDIGSGINWKRQGLKTILEQSLSGNVEEVVVAHRDRLCRFSFGLFELIFKLCKTNLVVLDGEVGQSKEHELADDILSIIHIYSCRKMGQRRYKNLQSANVS